MAATPPVSFLDRSIPRVVTKRPSCSLNNTPKSRLGRTFLIFSPWCDQGLGIQAKTYTHWLKQLGYTVLVYACKPSKVSNAAAPRQMQANSAEWAVGVTVKLDARSRETVPHKDVTEFATQNHVTDAIMLETCHRNIFVLSAALGRANIRVYAVPNIELVRSSELPFFREMRFHRILCSNEYTRDILRRLGVPKRMLTPFPFAIADTPKEVPLADRHMPGDPVRFLVVGGMNCERRKQASKIVAAFVAAFPKPSPHAVLTVLCQGGEAPRPSRRPDIVIKCGHTSYAQVLQHYANSHVVVMLSRAEGIGLCTHEALRAGCALLTMTSPLNTELVAPGVNGYLIKCEPESGPLPAKLVGNNEMVIRTHTFRVRGLASAFKTIATTPLAHTVSDIQAGARRSYEVIFAPTRVLRAYRRALDVAPVR